MVKVRDLKQQIAFTFFILIVVVAVLIAILGFYVIKYDIIERAQSEVVSSINAAQDIYSRQINGIKNAVYLFRDEQNQKLVKEVFGLDYLYRLEKPQLAFAKSSIVQKAVKNNKEVGGTRVIEYRELKKINPHLAAKTIIKIKDTPKAIATDKETLKDALAIEYAVPIVDDDNNLKAVKYAGKIINKDYQLVDMMRDMVFGDQLHKNRPIGTVTIFQDDVRVSTNVLAEDKTRAIGTRVSREVYQAVIQEGKNWFNRAFVVNDWYLTAYKPIHNINDKVIGILYVGLLERPFIARGINIFLAFILIIFLAVILAVFFVFVLASRISKPLKKLVEATNKISQGNFSYRIKQNIYVKEFRQLVNSFNKMAAKIEEREKKIKKAKQKSEELNKQYLDLVGFVSHELKGILASIVLNTYSLKNELLGKLTPLQKKTVNSIARNLNYLTQTVKNFLNLSRIEKQEMKINKKEIMLKEDIIDVALENFNQQVQEKAMLVENNISNNLHLFADPALMQVVVNNLLSNAIKYGVINGRIIFNAREIGGFLEVEVYNDGRPIDEVDLNKLFKKFSRIIYEDAQKVKGTGVGLYITREIIQRHGGSIWVKPRNKGNSFYFRIKYV
jgi:signal transduction histidine kinase